MSMFCCLLTISGFNKVTSLHNPAIKTNISITCYTTHIKCLIELYRPTLAIATKKTSSESSGDEIQRAVTESCNKNYSKNYY